MGLLRDLILRGFDDDGDDLVEDERTGLKPAQLFDLALARDTYVTRQISMGRDDLDFPDEEVAGWFHPSSVSRGICPRLEVIKRVRPDLLGKGSSDHDASLQRIFNVGHAFHWLYQNYIYGPMGILWGLWVRGRDHHFGFMPGPEWQYVEMPLWNKERQVVGHTDGPIVVDGYEPFFMDLKSKNSYAFRFVTEPSEEHRKQLLLYLDCEYGPVVRWRHGDEILEAPTPKDAPKPTCALVTYIAKDTGQEKDFWVMPDQTVLDSVYERTDLVISSMAEESLPRRAKGCPNKAAKQASECAACDACFEVNAGADAFALLKVL